ncbi:uncharacterized protein LOC126819421 [Patella vulgata]|uniref:uncharacterized protein LOC126819421 n=1 Tax=Patella vulgata TaxID=6465 RepID=UPI0021804889|nr:uncharacterized protein LOC126819421 [Patella vulgata]XP_050403413.1 uncharacterized protein LOC126819421 [Patella vulgata]
MYNVGLVILILMEMLTWCYSTGENKAVISQCEQLNCENENPCRTILSKNNDNEQKVECFCQGKWTGHRCELEIMLNASVLNSNSVQLKLLTRSPNNDVGIANSDSKYTLMYWSNDTNHACLMVQDLASTANVIDGLIPSMRYTFCFETGIVDFCEVTRYSLNLPANCVTVYMSQTTVVPTNSTIIIGVSLSAVFAILIIMVIISIILVKQQHCLPLEVVLDSCKCLSCTPKRNKSLRCGHSAQTRVLLSDPPIYTGPRQDELSPSKNKNGKRPSTRAKSYGSKSEAPKTLTTLLENTEAVEFIETSLSEPLAHPSV